MFKTDNFIISWFVLNSNGEATKLLKYKSENAETMKINEASHEGREFVADGNTFTVRFCSKISYSYFYLIHYFDINSFCITNLIFNKRTKNSLVSARIIYKEYRSI